MTQFEKDLEGVLGKIPENHADECLCTGYCWPVKRMKEVVLAACKRAVGEDEDTAEHNCAVEPMGYECPTAARNDVRAEIRANLLAEVTGGKK